MTTSQIIITIILEIIAYIILIGLPLFGIVLYIKTKIIKRFYYDFLAYSWYNTGITWDNYTYKDIIYLHKKHGFINVWKHTSGKMHDDGRKINHPITKSIIEKVDILEKEYNKKIVVNDILIKISINYKNYKERCLTSDWEGNYRPYDFRNQVTPEIRQILFDKGYFINEIFEVYPLEGHGSE
jgi:hypothetical protein